MSSEQQPRQVVRLSVNMHPDVARQFKELGKRADLNATDSVRRAIGLWKVVSDAHAEGERVLIRGRDGRYREIIINEGAA